MKALSENSDYPSVSFNSHGGEPMYVGVIGGKMHASLITWHVVCN